MTLIGYSRIFVFAVGLCLGGQAEAASFNCAKASSYVERAVCRNPALSVLDDEMSGLFSKLSTDPILKGEQRGWLKQVSKCDNESCIRESYGTRVVVLSSTISEAKRPSRTPVLVLQTKDDPTPPTKDDPTLKTRKVMALAAGKIYFSHDAAGGGYALEVENGGILQLAYVWSLDEKQATTISEIADNGVPVLVYGVVDVYGEGSAAFYSGAPIYIYRQTSAASAQPLGASNGNGGLLERNGQK